MPASLLAAEFGRNRHYMDPTMCTTKSWYSPLDTLQFKAFTETLQHQEMGTLRLRRPLKLTTEVQAFSLVSPL